MTERPRESPLQAWTRPAIGIDIGGTKVAAGLVDTDGRVLQRARRETPDRSKSPQVVEAGDLLIAPAQSALQRNLTARTHRPDIPVVPAALGNEAGMIGAADLARGRS